MSVADMEPADAAVADGYVRSGTLAKVMVDAVGARSEALALGPRERAVAEAMVKRVGTETGVKGMDEGRLWSEWATELIGSKDENLDRLLEALDDPAGNYHRWLEVRLRDPYRVSLIAFMKATLRIGHKNANLLVHVRWRQELAWARRLRASPDDRDAIVAQAFLVAAARDAGAEFVKLADAMLRAGDDLKYVLDPRHMVGDEQIDDGEGDDDFVPLFMRNGRMALADKLDAMPSRDLAAAAGAARKAQAAEVAWRRRMQIGHAVRQANLARNTGIIKVALEVGFDSDGLVEAHDDFARDLESGAVATTGATGLPLMEFYAWLRTRRPGGQVVAPPHAAIVASATILSIVNRPEGWLDALPGDYALMHPRDPATFHAWLQPLADGTRTFPQDPVLDYGFHLVATNFRLSVPEPAAGPPPRKRKPTARKASPPRARA